MFGILLSLGGLMVGILSLIFGYFLHIHSNKPSPTEIASELRQSLEARSDGFRVRTNNHVINIVDVKVTDNSDWLDQREDADRQWGYVLLNGIFVGSAEVIQQLVIPETGPLTEEIRQHPYYGEPVEFKDSDCGTNGFEVQVSGNTLILNVDFYADSVRKGAVCIIMTSIVLSQILDDIFTEQSDYPENITPFQEFMSKKIDRENIEYPVIQMEDLSKTDFNFPPSSE